MAALIIGLVIFFGVHSTAMAAPAFRGRAVARLGEGPWKGLYSLVAAVGLVLIVYGFHLARESPVVLYSPPGWLRYVTFLLMLPVFPLLIAAYLPGRIKTAMKHPLLNAVKFWALAHLLANGMLADLLLFGGFLVWAGVDRMSLKRRVQTVPAAPAGRFNDLIAVVGGLALYLLFIEWAHLRLFGVSPLSSG
jgi:uncharacterized membrane protein